MLKIRIGASWVSFWPATRRRVLALPVIVIAALTSTFLSELLFAWLFTPDVGAKLFYLHWFLFPTFAGLWAAVLFPLETRAFGSLLMNTRAVAPLAQLAVLAAAAAMLVSCGDLAFEWAGTSAMGDVLKHEVIWKRAWGTSSLILLAVYALTFAVTRRLAISLMLISPLYLGFVLANVLKVNYMDVAVHPLDLLRITEFLPFLRSFFGAEGIVAVIGTVGIWLWGLITIARTGTQPVSRTSRWVIGVMAFALLLALPIGFSQLPVLSSHWLLRILGAPDERFKEHARRHGVLLSFLSNLPAAFITRPNMYSSVAVKEAVARHSASAGEAPQTRPRVNLVLYLVESMMDPDDFGVRYTSDPIPTMRSLRRTSHGGWAIVPEAFGGSVNTEFEVLTGMSMCFLPERSLPYRQYLRRPIPSLPRALKDVGYRATAIQADPKYFFAREKAYDLLGFDDVRWLNEAPGIQRAVRGSSPSDAAIVDAILEVSRQAEPFFIFAFPASTHAPYNQGTYSQSVLAVAEPVPAEARSELQEYINALSVADREIARLIEHFGRQPTPTLIVILGDHLAPLSSVTRRLFVDQLGHVPAAERSLRSRRVPLAVWANFSLPKEDVEISTNALPSYVLRKLNLEPRQFLAVNDAVRRTIPVLGRRVPDCGWGEGDLPGLDRTAHTLLSDYRLLQ